MNAAGRVSISVLILTVCFLGAAPPNREMLEKDAERRAAWVSNQLLKQGLLNLFAMKISHLSLPPGRPAELILGSGNRPASEESMVLRIFFACQKHAPANLEAQKPWVEEIAAAWDPLSRACVHEGLDTAAVAEWIWRFSQSDFGPVACSRGRGQDDITNAAAFRAWAEAVIAKGAQAKRRGKDPASAWWNLFMGHFIQSAANLLAAPIDRIPPPPAW